MIKSMTGYGRARQELHKRDITVEVRSVNNRYLDCTVKMPRMYAFAEDAVKKHVQQAVSRGKVDVFITVDATAADVVKVAVNRELAAQYAAALGELSDVCGTADYRPAPETLARFPDVLTVTKADEDLETVSADLCAVLDEALAAYNDMRAVEGQKLAEDISNRLDAIERYTGQVEMRSPETVAEYRAKLTARMEEVLQSTTVDEQRILMEAAIYAGPRWLWTRRPSACGGPAWPSCVPCWQATSHGPEDGLPDPGGQPGVQHHRLQVQRCGHCQCSGGAEGGSGEDAGAGPECGVMEDEAHHIGFGNLVSADRLVAVVGPDSAPIKRMVQESRERGMLIDATYGRKTASILSWTVTTWYCRPCRRSGSHRRKRERTKNRSVCI